LRELISNANDAVEKLRLTALKDRSVWDGADPLNITIKAYPDEDGKGGKLVITGMFIQVRWLAFSFSLFTKILVLVCLLKSSRPTL
jgi:hypothetical protein